MWSTDTFRVHLFRYRPTASGAVFGPFEIIVHTEASGVSAVGASNTAIVVVVDHRHGYPPVLLATGVSCVEIVARSFGIVLAHWRKSTSVWAGHSPPFASFERKYPLRFVRPRRYLFCCGHGFGSICSCDLARARAVLAASCIPVAGAPQLHTMVPMSSASRRTRSSASTSA